MQGLNGHCKEYEPYSKHDGTVWDGIERGLTWSIYALKSSSLMENGLKDNTRILLAWVQASDAGLS